MRYLDVPFGEERNYSERTTEEIDAEVRRLVGAEYDRVKKLLGDMRHDLDAIATELLRKQTLDRTEIEQLIHQPVPSA